MSLLYFIIFYIYECGAIGSASVSKTEGWEFDSLHSCRILSLEFLKLNIRVYIKTKN